LDALWRYDQYIANAENREDIQKFWNDVKAQEQQNIERLKKLVLQEIQKDCF